MINGEDFYNVMSAMVPLYVAMVVAYASVRWWKIFSAEQCSGINRFVAAFAVPLLSFHSISSNNPYKMDLLFVGADTLQKGALLLLLLLGSWAALLRRPAVLGSTPLEWLITVFSLATLPNTLVMGIPLLVAMYGEPSGAGALMVQVVVLQSIVWYTLLLVLFELRAAKALISGNFPDTAAGIASIEVESDVVSLHGDRLETEPHVGPDGRLRVTIRRSVSSALAGAEIYSLSSAESRGSNFFSYGFEDLYSDHGSVGPMTPRPSTMMARSSTGKRWYPSPSSEFGVGGRRSYKRSRSGYREMQRKGGYGGRELHMFRWSARESPMTEFGRLHLIGGGGLAAVESYRDSTDDIKEIGSVGFDRPQINETKEGNQQERKDSAAGGEATVAAGKQMPPTSVMTKLIVVMVCRKLLRNPNTYASILGLVWSLISYRWDFKMPKIVANSISILSNTSLGMAMFSLGLFMAMQPKLIACGNSLALFSMAVRFIIGPAVMAVASVAVGIRGNLLRISILQAALPQGIVPFVFAKEYDNHPTILSTAVIFGMIVALPVDILYYILLGL